MKRQQHWDKREKAKPESGRQSTAGPRCFTRAAHRAMARAQVQGTAPTSEPVKSVGAVQKQNPRAKLA